MLVTGTWVTGSMTVGWLATWKNGSGTVSVAERFHSTVTWLSPGTRKKSGRSGANGSRKWVSNTDCATFALPSSEPGTASISAWVTSPLASASLKPR